MDVAAGKSFDADLCSVSQIGQLLFVTARMDITQFELKFRARKRGWRA